MHLFIAFFPVASKYFFSFYVCVLSRLTYCNIVVASFGKNSYYFFPSKARQVSISIRYTMEFLRLLALVSVIQLVFIVPTGMDHI